MQTVSGDQDGFKERLIENRGGCAKTIQITVDSFLNCRTFPENLFSDGMPFSGEDKTVNTMII